jgi:hypothetical protein
MTDTDYQYTTDSNCDDVDVGPFELRNSSNTLISTLWAGTGSLTVAGAYAAAGSQASQGVGALTASNSSIELWLQIIMDTANVTGAICESSIDNFDITITHAAPPTGMPRRSPIVISLDRNPEGVKVYETYVTMTRHNIYSRTRRAWWREE